MAFNPTSPVAGGSQLSFTSPTYTLSADNAPTNAKQWTISSVGGTQVGAIAHALSIPFTLAIFRPANPQILGPVNPVTGMLKNVPMNRLKVITRKGVIPLSGQAARTMVITTTIDVPAGAETYDAANVKAACSLHFGALWEQSSGLGLSTYQGSI